MSTGRIPKAYINDVPKTGDADPRIVTVPFSHLAIGGRPSTLKNVPTNGLEGLSHVRGGATGKR